MKYNQGSVAFSKAVAIAGSQAQLSRASGISQGVISRLAHGVQAPLPSSVLAICRAVGWAVTPHEALPSVYPSDLDGIPPEQHRSVKSRLKRRLAGERNAAPAPIPPEEA